jgi:TRAP-type C4-dicarboxylate transport system substrate-binding protein
LDGTADIAFVAPGYTPERFPDTSVLELPGLLREIQQGTLVYNRLVSLNALAGYEDFLVIGAFMTEGVTIHSRTPIGSIDDLKGKRLRVNNPIEAAALAKLGAVPMVMQINASFRRHQQRHHRRKRGINISAVRLWNKARRRLSLFS